FRDGANAWYAANSAATSPAAYTHHSCAEGFALPRDSCAFRLSRFFVFIGTLWLVAVSLAQNRPHPQIFILRIPESLPSTARHCRHGWTQCRAGFSPGPGVCTF